MKSKEQYHRRIKELKRENKQLKRELARIKKNDLSEDLYDFGRGRHKPLAEKKLAEHARTVELYRRPHFYRYLISLVKTSFLYGIWNRVYTHVRRYKFIRWTLGILFTVFAILQSSAVFLVLSALSVVLVPIFFLSTILLTIAAKFRKKGEKEKLVKAFRAHPNVAIFMPPRTAFEGDSSFSSWVMEFAKNEDTLVLIVSPFLISPKALSSEGSAKKRYFVAARQESDQVFLLRGYYYFRLCAFLKKERTDLTVFY